MMDLRDLRYFETIAEHEHLGRAALILHRSAPALTKCIRRLEKSLGTVLFERDGRRIRLTAAGHTLKKRSRALAVVMEDTQREIDAVTGGSTGHLRIGVVPTIAQFLLPGACRVFLGSSSSDVTIETLIGMANLLRDALRVGEIDMAVSVDTADNEFNVHPLIDDEVVVVAGSNHEIFRKRATVADLGRYSWVLPVASYDTEIRRFIDAAFQRHSLPRPRVQIETTSVTLLPNLIAATGLLSFISRRNLGRGHVAAPLREVRMKEMTMHRKFALIYRKNSYLSPVALRFGEMLRSKGQSLFASGAFAAGKARTAV